MKSKYERMSKLEKRKVFDEFKKEKSELAKKFKNMFILCNFGLIYGLCFFFYDLFVSKGKLNYILDIIVFIVSFIALIFVNKIKKDILNKYILKNKKRF